MAHQTARKRPTSETRFKFLTDEWFDRVDQLIAAAGDLELTDAARHVAINISVTSAKGRVTKVHFREGRYQRGHHDDCRTSLTLPELVARKIIIEGDGAAGVRAFFEGKIVVEGDVTGVLALQTVEPSIVQLRLARQIQTITV